MNTAKEHKYKTRTRQSKESKYLEHHQHQYHYEYTRTLILHLASRNDPWRLGPGGMRVALIIIYYIVDQEKLSRMSVCECLRVSVCA